MTSKHHAFWDFLSETFFTLKHQSFLVFLAVKKSAAAALSLLFIGLVGTRTQTNNHSFLVFLAVKKSAAAALFCPSIFRPSVLTSAALRFVPFFAAVLPSPSPPPS